MQIGYQKETSKTFFNFIAMIQNYIKTTLRNIIKHRALSTINILGLTIGLTAVILIGIYVRYEFSFDRFHKHAENIYRVERKGKMDGKSFHLPHTNNNIPRALAGEYPSITDFIRIWPANGMIRDHHNNFHQEQIYLADNSFLEVFTFPLKKGNKHTALEAPYSVVMTEELARKYFGDTEVIGKTLEAQVLDSNVTLNITGVMEEMPDNSHLQSDMLVSYETAKSIAPAQYLNTWVGNYLYSYLKVKPGTDIQQLESQFPKFVDKHMDAEFRKILGEDSSISEFMQLHLQPLTDIYLFARLDYAIGPTGDISKVYTAIGIALLILIIACINYINLSTAKSLTRAREVGMRKVFGAFRRKVIGQFIAESVILALLALILSMIVVESVLPAFNAFLDKELTIGYFSQPVILLVLIGLAVLIGILAGLYPAVHISSYRPVTMLKSLDQGPAGSSSANIRKGLVILQFAISVALLISVFTMNRQLNFMINKDLGFKQEKVMVVQSNDRKFRQNMQTLKERLTQVPEISHIALADNNLGETEYGDGVFRVKDKPKNTTENFWMINIGEDFLSTLQINLLEGRSFSEDFRSDRQGAYIINEAAMKKLGITDPQKAVGTQLVQNRLDGQSQGKIVGVVKNFHFQPLQIKIKPLIFTYQAGYNNHMFLKIGGNDMQQTITKIQKAFAEQLPNFTFHYSFLDNQYRQGYQKEIRMKKMFTVFSILAIFIASMGLFGLAAFMTERKTKEIGIRKAIGASTGKIVAMLSSQFLKWVLLANLIAWPLVYFVLKSWLQNFAYHIDLQVGYFLLATGIAIFVAQATVFYQAFTAARTNPVESLRYE